MTGGGMIRANGFMLADGEQYVNVVGYVKGCRRGNRFRVDMPRLLSLWRQGRLKLDHLLSGLLELGAINEGVAALKSAALVRQLIDFGG
jgi:Zn-dependent alcohol dehydrogenase